MSPARLDRQNGAAYRPSGVEEPILSRATMTVTEAAAVLGISRSTAYELARAGTLPALRLGRRLVVPTHALEELLESARPSS